jgi:hypothetical protein
VNIADYDTQNLMEEVTVLDWDNFDFDDDELGMWEDFPQFEGPCFELYLKRKGHYRETDHLDCKENFRRYDQEIFNGNRRHQRETYTVYEFCAWYTSFRHNMSTPWGIHIKYDCMKDEAKRIYKLNRHLSKNGKDAMKSAFLSIFCHEFFHYQVDLATAVMELTRDQPLYKKYFHNVYKQTYNNPGALEESLANRYLYERHRFCKIRKESLFLLLKNSPPGYNAFDKYTGKKFGEGKRMLSNQILIGDDSPNILLPIEQVFEILNPASYAKGHRIPIYIHYTKGRKERIVFKKSPRRRAKRV